MWWLDPALGLLIAGVAVKGREALRGGGRRVSSPLDGVAFAYACQDDRGGPGARTARERRLRLLVTC